MTREAIDRWIQACVKGQAEYVTEEGISIQQRGRRATKHVSPVLDALMEQYAEATRDLHVSVHALAVAAGVRPEEVMRALLALTDVYLVSHHVEERLLTIHHMKIDSSRKLSVHVTFSAWLTYHLERIRNARPQVGS